MVKIKRRRAGYTLMEAMLVVAIIGIVASVGSGMLISINRFYLLTKTRNDLQKQGRAALYLITRELRQAQSNSIVIDRAAAGQPFFSRITFTKQPLPGQTTGTVVQFEQVGNQLIQINQGNNGSGKIVLSSSLAYLAFTFPRSDDLTIVSVSLTLQENTYQGQIKALHMASEQCQIMD